MDAEKSRRGTRDPALIRRMVDAATAKRATISREDRFWAKVNKSGPNGCWVWTGARVGAGASGGRYGYFWNGTTAARAHRHSYELAHGPIPAGLVIDHICRNILCVRPEHLRAVTPHINGTENNLSPIAACARQTKCKYGHPYTPENTAFLAGKKRKNRHGKYVINKRGARACLTCYPYHWRDAIVPRPRPPGSKFKPTDPDYHLRPGQQQSAAEHGPKA